MGVSQQAIKQRSSSCFLHAKTNYVRCGIKCGDQLRSQQEHHNANQFRQNDRCQNPKPCSSFCPLCLSRTEVLPYKGRHGHGKAVDWQKSKAFNFAVSSIARHCHFTKGIDIGLYHNVGKRYDRVLYSGGKSNAYDLTQHFGIKPYFRDLKFVAVICPQQLNQT